jgi:hypothetical protein
VLEVGVVAGSLRQIGDVQLVVVVDVGVVALFLERGARLFRELERSRLV